MIHLKNVGNAPLLKNPKIRVNGNDKFAKVINFLKSKMSAGNIFLYINSAFAPTPSASIKDLYQCFRVQNELIVNYALTEAWG